MSQWITEIDLPYLVGLMPDRNEKDRVSEGRKVKEDTIDVSACGGSIRMMMMDFRMWDEPGGAGC